MHSQRARRLGNPEAPVTPYRDLAALVEFHIDRTSQAPCWEWTGNRIASGYGRVGTPGAKTRYAHIVVYELLVGLIPEGMTLDHECHNRAAERGECAGGPSCPHRRCVNPAHLVPKPGRDNQRASVNTNAGKTHCKHGHEFTPENTYLPPRGGERVCRICRRAYKRQWRKNGGAS